MAEKRLPRFIVLKSLGSAKYLTHLRDDHDYLQLSGTDFTNLHSKFELVPSSNKEEGLVHLKCCYNQMYWVCRPDQWRITADAHEMEEDQTKRSCTLFKPVFDGSTSIAFYHVSINRSVICSTPFGLYLFGTTPPLYLKVGDPSNMGDGAPLLLDFFDYFELLDWESLPILPRYIALKGECGNYLSVYEDPYNSYRRYQHYRTSRWPEDFILFLGFNGKDKGDQTIWNEVFTTPDGKIRLKSKHTGKFWRLNNEWICPDSTDNTNNNLHTLFEVTKLNHNKIALKNLGNNMFCQGHATDCLKPNSTIITETAEFLVVELVDKRNIFNVRFDEKAVRIYEKEILSRSESSDLNNTEAAIQATMEFEYTKEESQTWTTSDSLKQTVDTEITFGPPNIMQGKIKYAHEVTKIVDKGKTLATKIVTKFTRTITVLPHSKVDASFRVMQAFCDIPYTYSMTETFTNGSPSVTYDKDDGLYTSVTTQVHFEAN